MDAGPALVANRQAAEPMQPGEGAFDDPARLAQAAAVGCPSFRQLRRDAPVLELVAVGLRVVTPVALDEGRLPCRSTGASAQRRHRINEREQLGDVVSVRGGHDRDDRNPVRVGENMMFRPGFAAIGRVRSSFFPPRNARSDALSTTARSRSS